MDVLKSWSYLQVPLSSVLSLVWYNFFVYPIKFQIKLIGSQWLKRDYPNRGTLFVTFARIATARQQDKSERLLNSSGLNPDKFKSLSKMKIPG